MCGSHRHTTHNYVTMTFYWPWCVSFHFNPSCISLSLSLCCVDMKFLIISLTDFWCIMGIGDNDLPTSLSLSLSLLCLYDTPYTMNIYMYNLPFWFTVRIGDDDLLPTLMHEFPFLHVSPHTAQRMWAQQMKHMEHLTKAAISQKYKKPKTQSKVRTASSKCCLVIPMLIEKHP